VKIVLFSKTYCLALHINHRLRCRLGPPAEEDGATLQEQTSTLQEQTSTAVVATVAVLEEATVVAAVAALVAATAAALLQGVVAAAIQRLHLEEEVGSVQPAVARRGLR